MPKKTAVNTKVAAANERKAANQSQKDKKKAEEAEQREAEDWAGGSKGKSKKDADAEKKVIDWEVDQPDSRLEWHVNGCVLIQAAAAAKKAEAARLLVSSELLIVSTLRF